MTHFSQILIIVQLFPTYVNARIMQLSRDYLHKSLSHFESQ